MLSFLRPQPDPHSSNGIHGTMSDTAANASLEVQQRLADAGAEAKKQFGECRGSAQDVDQDSTWLDPGSCARGRSIDRMADQATMKGSNGTGGSLRVRERRPAAG